MQIKLTDAQVTRIRRPVKGRGGFQSLLRRVQSQIRNNVLTATPGDIEKLRRYSSQYGDGGFQGRLL